MNFARLNSDIYLFAFAVADTLLVITGLYDCMNLIIEFYCHKINQRICIEQLNVTLPIITYLHLVLTVFMLMFGHPYLFLLNLFMAIWYWRKLPLGYGQDTFIHPGNLAKHAMDIRLQLIYFWTCLSIYSYYLIKTIIETNSSDKGQEPLFELQTELDLADGRQKPFFGRQQLYFGVDN